MKTTRLGTVRIMVGMVCAAATTRGQTVDMVVRLYESPPPSNNSYIGVDLINDPGAIGTPVSSLAALTPGSTKYAVVFATSSTLNGISTAGFDLEFNPATFRVPSQTCQGGANNGQPCTSDANCGLGTCNKHVFLNPQLSSFQRCPGFSPAVRWCGTGSGAWLEASSNLNCDVDLDCRTCVGGSNNGGSCSASDNQNPNVNCPGGICSVRTPPEFCLPDPLLCVPAAGLVDDVGGTFLSGSGGIGPSGTWARVATVELVVQTQPQHCARIEVMRPTAGGGPTGTSVDLVLWGQGKAQNVNLHHFVVGATGDDDCDGTANGGDNCPDVVNPLQDNVDGNGGGDLCDVCPGDSTDACEVDGSGAAEFYPGSAQVLSVSDGGLSLDVPATGLAVAETMSATRSSQRGQIVDIQPSGAQGAGRVIDSYQLKPDGLTFNSAATLTLSADVTGLTPGGLAALGIYRKSGNLYELVSDDCVVTEGPPDVFTASCSASIASFSEYALVNGAPFIPAVSEWGLLALTLLLLCAGTIRLGRRAWSTQRP